MLPLSSVYLAALLRRLAMTCASPRGGGDKARGEILQDGFEGQKIRRLVVHQKEILLFDGTACRLRGFSFTSQRASRAGGTRKFPPCHVRETAGAAA